MVYKRINIGLTLTSTAILLGFLSLELTEIPYVIWITSTDTLTITLVCATFGIMLLCQLYRETGLLKMMSQGLTKTLKNSKLVIALLPAIIGLLPVPGGALMSAPLIEDEAKKLELKADKTTYINIWFRHTIFPIYPLSQFIILSATLTRINLSSLILRQIPVTISMIVIGYFIALRKVSPTNTSSQKIAMSTNYKYILIGFAPILIMIFSVIFLNLNIAFIFKP